MDNVKNDLYYIRKLWVINKIDTLKIICKGGTQT